MLSEGHKTPRYLTSLVPQHLIALSDGQIELLKIVVQCISKRLNHSLLFNPHGPVKPSFPSFSLLPKFSTLSPRRMVRLREMRTVECTTTTSSACFRDLPQKYFSCPFAFGPPSIVFGDRIPIHSRVDVKYLKISSFLGLTDTAATLGTRYLPTSPGCGVPRLGAGKCLPIPRELL